MTLKRERPRPVDWIQETRERIETEHGDWFKTYMGAVLRRMALFEYFEVHIPAKDGKRDLWNKLDWYIKDKKIPWAPRGFLG